MLFRSSLLVKAADWAYEREWRIPGGKDKTNKTEDVPFYVEEITAIYLGCRISEENAVEIREIVDKKYAHASVYVGKKSERRFALEFTKDK